MRVELLDYGYLDLVETWGSDECIIEAARMSTAKGFLGWGPKHDRACIHSRFGDDDWNDSTRASYNRTYGEDPPCTCEPKPGDEKLLRYLWEHDHATPFEMAGATFEVKAPIFMFREWHRHRVPFGYNELCLSGDTEITCIGSGGLTQHYTIEHIYKMKHEGVVDHVQPGSSLPPGFTRNGYSRAGTPVLRHRRLKHRTEAYTRVRILPSCQHRTLRVLDEGNEIFTTSPMLDVWEAGVKDVFMVKTRNGHAIKASVNHPFYTREGWKKVGQLRPGDMLAANGLVAVMERPVPPSLRAGIGVWTSMMRSRLIGDEDVCYVCGGRFEFDDLHLDHVVPVVVELRRALDEENLKPICKICHRRKTNEEQKLRQAKTGLGLRWVLIDGKPERIGKEMTYDIEVDGPHKNFVANGLVVHNSARYTPLPDENYCPTVERVVEGSLATRNKQASSVAGPCNESAAEAWLESLRSLYHYTQGVYERGLEVGVPKELARLAIPVARYSRMRATGNLRGWLAFLKLRNAPTAQWEIRQYATALQAMLAEKFPRTLALFEEVRNK